jgi:SAM-dependent methyltransferase
MRSATQGEAAYNQPFDPDAVFEADDYLYFYEDFLTDERTDNEVAALVSLVELDVPLGILDLACGHGRHANRLAARGHKVTGVDRSPDFLEVARCQAAEMGVEVDYRQGDMRELDFDAEFDRVLLLFTAFGYFCDEGNLSVLKNAARALKPGGLLVFDSPSRDTFLKQRLPFNVIEKEGNLLIERDTFDPITGRSTNLRIVIRDGVRKDKPFSVRLYSPTEIPVLLGQAGLELHGLYGGWDGQPLTAEDHRMVVVARKPRVL